MFKKKMYYSKISKKTMVLILIVSLSLSILSACGKAPDATSNKDGSYANMVVQDVPERGLRFSIPQEAFDKGVTLDPYNENLNGQPIQTLYFYYTPITDKLFDDMIDTPAEERTQEMVDEFYEQLYTHSKCLMNIVLFTKEEYQNAIASGKSLDELSGYDNTEELGENDGYIYLVSIPTNDLEGMSEEEKSLYEECRKYMATVKEEIKFIPLKLESNETVLPTQVPSFSTRDLNGNPVTEKIFQQKDLTMVNIWGTFCTPCIEEMPELGEIARSMPENVQMVGLITDIERDGDKNHKLAQNIVTRANADFVQIIANEDLEDLLKNIIGVPTTFFVDKDGYIIGEPIVGADIEEYEKRLEEYSK
ncbi:TlpA family protein disulfide reductase [Alkaliphilus crotonatoxidans]